MKLVYAIFIGLILFMVSEAQNKPPQETAFDRFLRYAKIETQSKEDQ